MPRNALVAQSGGPSPVINSSLRGVTDGLRGYPEQVGRLYAGWHGIEGVLQEELLDLSAQADDEIARLAHTPAAGAIGTCRYKLKSGQAEDFERILAVLKAHEIGFFLYTGGNDSMETAHKVAELARARGLDLAAVGVPKTIDNDVGDAEMKLVDHTPGYGSVARYWACCVQNAEEENRGSSPSDPVLVMQAMGRKIGFIPAAARLADPKRELPLLIVLAAAGLAPENLADAVNDLLKSRGRALVVVSEGFNMGSIGERRDAFGHVEFGASETTVEQALVNYLNSKGLAARGHARGHVPGTDQRATAIYASTVDVEEAYQAGKKAAELAATGQSGFMATILRAPEKKYQAVYDKVPLEKVATADRSFPAAWIAKNKLDVTNEFVRYARPLIGTRWPKVPLAKGLQRFTRFQPVYAAKQLPAYVPQGYRK